ncbi:MAG: hypothetical protein ACRDT7_15780 [Microbacterium sp.]
MTKATSVFLAATIALVAYGLFATLYWPVTAVSADVWTDGYARMPSENVTAMCIGTAVWLLLAIVLSVSSVRNRRPPFLISFGIIAITLLMPTTLASVAVYNVIPTSSPYPDMLTPFVLLLGAVSIVGGIFVIWTSRRGTAREVAASDPDY